MIATRYEAPFDAYDALAVGERREPMVSLQPIEDTVYVAGRDLGDEYRYILDRKRSERFPGNMLTRPGMLLNPWAVRDTETGEQLAAAGEAYARRQSQTSRVSARTAADTAAPRTQGYALDTDFLATPALVVSNLQPDADGGITLDRAMLGDRHYLHIIAIDGTQTVARSHALPRAELALRDLRVIHGLDPQRHFVQHRSTELLQPGERVAVRDLGEVRIEAYDTLAKVYNLFATLTTDAGEAERLAAFRFVLDWPTYDDAQKREKYAKYASHELHFFLYHKDRAFFDEVVRPYLANKRDKTFLDRYLLDEDLASYQERWAYAQLNVAERILLGQRVDRAAEVDRHVRDRFELLPPDAAERDRLFQIALRAGAMAMEQPLSEVMNDARRLGRPQLRSDASEAFATEFMGVHGGAGDVPAPAAEPAESRAMNIAAQTRSNVDARALRQMRESEPGTVEESAPAAPAFDAAPQFALRSTLEYADAEELQALRQQVRRFYRALDPTREWAESNYYHRRITEHVASLVEVNRFWRDYAAHDGNGPFVSPNLAEAAGTFTEMMLALSLLDLPFEAGEHDIAFDDGAIHFEAASPALVFYHEVREAEIDDAAEASPILVSENFFKIGDRHRTVDGEQVDHFITDEFVLHQPYGGHVVVTNPTSSRQRLQVLMQLPRGAMPLQASQPTPTRQLALEPYQTVSIEYAFYFPEPGEYVHFPVHVARQEALVAFDRPMVFHVVPEPTRVDTESWDYISQHGAREQVIAFLKAHNVESINLGRIAWRMSDRAFFITIIELLDSRLAYDATLWSYGIKHDHVPAVREYLRFRDDFVAQAGSYLNTTLLTIDPVERRSFELLEYSPFVQPRMYQLGARRRIINPAMADQYLRMLDVLAHRPELSDDDRLMTSYYLLLQNRIADAMTMFRAVEREQVHTTLQYDYFQAYLAFYTGELEIARELAERYADHPVERWATRFAGVLSQLNEIEGRGNAALIDPDERDAQHERLAQTEPALAFTISDDQIELTYANLQGAQVNYYLIDLELLFSSQPFVQSYGDQFAYIRPNETQRIELDVNAQRHTVELPEAVQRRNVLIEIVAGPVRRSEAHFASAMNVQVIENYGQVQVTARADDQPLPKVYVKVYARMADGQTRFFKDGYTDLRGRFDYASVSGEQQTGAERFSILLLSDELGAEVREVSPPRR